MTMKDFKFKEVLNIAVIVAALGYFVDVYDLVLFLIIGKASLLDLGVSKPDLIPTFQYLLSVQMIGMLIGGIFWGILSDKKGRLAVLFSCIIMYSLANIANGFVVQISTYTEGIFTPIQVYAIMRFLAGIGLAGELGVGITLVSEIMNKETRGMGTSIVASVGVIGAVVAAIIGKFVGWEASYFVGGALGLSLLILRIGVFESGMFKNLENKKVRQGEFFLIFEKKERALRYINCILIGLPVWFIIGILVGRAPEIAATLGISGVDQVFCVMLCYSGLTFGDVLSGVLSQIFRSRKKILYSFFLFAIVMICIYINLYNASLIVFYTVIFLLGLSVGFWAIFVTVASEQFGTNLRGTVTTTVPNFVRGSLVLVAICFDLAVKSFGVLEAIVIVTITIMAISFFSLYNLKETFGKDLDHLEE
jgi:MFS transporter, putative metabolite:H+ symporter